MDKRLYHLHWTNHVSNMKTVFTSLFETRHLTDVSIVCTDGTLFAHRLVLSACSNYFLSLFNDIRTKQAIVVLSDIPTAVVRHILTFIYTGQVKVDEQEVNQMLDVAKLLEIRGLYESNVLSQSEAVPTSTNFVAPTSTLVNTSDSFNQLQPAISDVKLTPVDELPNGCTLQTVNMSQILSTTEHKSYHSNVNNSPVVGSALNISTTECVQSGLQQQQQQQQRPAPSITQRLPAVSDVNAVAISSDLVINSSAMPPSTISYQSTSVWPQKPVANGDQPEAVTLPCPLPIASVTDDIDSKMSNVTNLEWVLHNSPLVKSGNCPICLANVDCSRVVTAEGVRGMVRSHIMNTHATDDGDSLNFGAYKSAVEGVVAHQMHNDTDSVASGGLRCKFCADDSLEFTSTDDLRVHIVQAHCNQPQSQASPVTNTGSTEVRRKQPSKQSKKDIDKANENGLPDSGSAVGSSAPGLTQTRLREYECDVCHARFGRLSHLQRHHRTHTGEKPYKCTTCQQAFARQDKLKSHMDKHARQSGLSVETKTTAKKRKTSSKSSTKKSASKCGVNKATSATTVSNVSGVASATTSTSAFPMAGQGSTVTGLNYDWNHGDLLSNSLNVGPGNVSTVSSGFLLTSPAVTSTHPGHGLATSQHLAAFGINANNVRPIQPALVGSTSLLSADHHVTGSMHQM